MRIPTWDQAVLDARRLAKRAQRCQIYQFADGFDNYSTLSQLWELVSGSSTIGTSYRRFAPPSGISGQGLYLPSGSYARKNMLSTQQTFIIKLAYSPQAYSGSSQGTNIVGVLNTGVFCVNLVLVSTGAIQIWNQWATPYSAQIGTPSGPGVIVPGNYYGIEVLFTLASGGSNGIVQVWVNGAEVLNESGLSNPNSNANQIQIGDTVNAGTYYDDVRVWDNTGSTQNAPLGTDSRLITSLPAGAGGFTQFTPNGAAANWQCVDDNPPDGDTTYVSGASSGLQDAYSMQNPGLTQPPVMVVARSYVRKDDSGTRSLEIGVDSSGSTAVGSSAAVGSSYAFMDACIPDDPHTSAAWTAAGANAAQHYKQETA